MKILLEVLANHEKEHETRPKFKISTLNNVSGKCLSCNQHFGVK